MEILDGVLAYRILNSAHLTNEQKQSVKATVCTMYYQIMKDQLKKDQYFNVDNKTDIDKIDVKSEENEISLMINKIFYTWDILYIKN